MPTFQVIDWPWWSPRSTLNSIISVVLAGKVDLRHVQDLIAGGVAGDDDEVVRGLAAAPGDVHILALLSKLSKARFQGYKAHVPGS